MKRKFLLLFGIFLCCASCLYGQYDVTITLTNVPENPANPEIYLAGNMNGWSQSDSGFLLKKENNQFHLTLHHLKKGIYHFKFTRGSWKNVECQSNGNDISNRTIKVSSDTSLYLTIAGWKDQFKTTPIHHTMSPNVTIISTDFAIPQLHRTRRIWAYLPPDYKTSTKRYSVLYMQDGQNLFDAATSAYGEWGVDEILDSLYQRGAQDVIVIGIDNGEDKRINEYNPYNNDKYGKGEGKKYVKFLVNTLKPFIDTHFRTIPDAAHTGIAGSSMGGLISFYAWLKYPNIFGKAGIFSPSFWIAPQINKEIHLTNQHKQGKIFFIAGEAESTTMISDMKSIYDELLQQGMPASRMQIKAVPGAQHNEVYWHEEFPGVFLWLFDSN